MTKTRLFDVTLRVNVPLALRQQLRDESQRRGATMSEIVRQLIRSELSRVSREAAKA
ncbi:unnamed protein product [marine sediment metagenome]|uniref:Uncharacterized protein n=1 Tax=marine sediment metagenome TaxID=412755 RepID=X1J7N2_9ZZZZ